MTVDDFELHAGATTCTSCRAHGRCRLGVGDADPLPDGGVAVPAVCPADWQGGPEVAHGGWISAAFDEALSLVVLQHDARIVTQRLTVHYRRPVPVLRPLIFTGRIVGREGRSWLVAGRLMLGPEGPLLANGEGTFVSRRQDHYRRHQASLRGHST
jgi:hypothetical protein